LGHFGWPRTNRAGSNVWKSDMAAPQKALASVSTIAPSNRQNDRAAIWAPTSLGTLGTGRDRGRAPLGFESGPDHYILQLSPSLYLGVALQRHRLRIHNAMASTGAALRVFGNVLLSCRLIRWLRRSQSPPKPKGVAAVRAGRSHRLALSYLAFWARWFHAAWPRVRRAS
jgi:hypothetical protein